MRGSPRLGAGLMIAFAASALGWCLTSRANAAPAWLLAAGALIGIISTTASWTTEVERSPVTWASFGTFVLLVLLERHLFGLLVGTQLATAGILGLYAGRIVVAGRVGPARVRSGRAASLDSLLFLAAGVTSVVWALLS